MIPLIRYYCLYLDIIVSDLIQNSISFHVVLASLVECYYNRTIIRFSIQTAGLAFGGTGLCSYRVRVVGAVVQSI